MNCQAVNEVWQWSRSPGLFPVSLRFATRFDETFLSFRFRGRRRRVKVAEGCSHPRDNAYAGARVVRPRLSPVKHSNVSIKQPPLSLSPFILSIPSCKMAATHFKRVCLRWQTIKMSKNDEKRYPILKFFEIQIQKWMNCTQKLDYNFLSIVLRNRTLQNCYHFSLKDIALRVIIIVSYKNIQETYLWKFDIGPNRDDYW